MERSVLRYTPVGAKLELALAEDLAVIPQVRHVVTEWVDGPLLVWIAFDDPNPAGRRQIHPKESDLIGGFPEVDFDFQSDPRTEPQPGSDRDRRKRCLFAPGVAIRALQAGAHYQSSARLTSAPALRGAPPVPPRPPPRGPPRASLTNQLKTGDRDRMIPTPFL